MKTSQALQKVLKVYQERKRERYICSAAIFAAGRGIIPYTDATTIRLHIHELLQPASTLEGWLLRNGHVDDLAAFCSDSPRHLGKLRRTRILWIKDMIQYFQEKERGELGEKACGGKSGSTE